MDRLSHDHEAAYERLLRDLHGTPIEAVPPLGGNPFAGTTEAQARAAIRNDPARWHDGRTGGMVEVNLNENSGHLEWMNDTSDMWTQNPLTLVSRAAETANWIRSVLARSTSPPSFKWAVVAVVSTSEAYICAPEVPQRPRQAERSTSTASVGPGTCRPITDPEP
jgi:hypothetical protein